MKKLHFILLFFLSSLWVSYEKIIDTLIPSKETLLTTPDYWELVQINGKTPSNSCPTIKTKYFFYKDMRHTNTDVIYDSNKKRCVPVVFEANWTLSGSTITMSYNKWLVDGQSVPLGQNSFTIDIIDISSTSLKLRDGTTIYVFQTK